MESRANYALVGVFTLLVIAGIFAFVYWFSRAGEGNNRRSYRIIFTGSVTGLSRGALVRFNGLRVGEVTSISITPSDPSKMLVLVDVDRETPIKADTKARLEYLGLTGLATVQLIGGTSFSPDLATNDPTENPIIFADRSDYQDVLETVQRLSHKVDNVLTNAGEILSQAQGPMITALRNTETFSRALSDNSDDVAEFLANVGAMSRKVGSLSARMEKFIDEVDGLIQGIDSGAVNKVVNNIVAFSETLQENRQNIQVILVDTANLVKKLDASATTLQRVLEGSAEFSDALGRQSPAVEGAIKDVVEVARRVSLASTRFDNVMAGVEKLLGGGVEGLPSGMMNDISEAARAIRVLAENLDKRSADLSSGLTRFSGNGLREYENLAVEARKATAEFSRFLRSFENNPQQLLLGNRPTLPEYRR